MKRRPRWVLDTNVVVSAMLWGGKPAQIMILAGEGEVRLFTSRALLDELTATLSKPRLAKAIAATGRSANDLIADYRQLVTVIRPKPLDRQISRDIDDDAVIASAISAQAEIIVSGDADLLVLAEVEGISICPTAQALDLIEA